MKLLLDDTFAPTTSEIGFLETDLETAADGYLSWQREIAEKHGFVLQQEHLSDPFSEAMRSLMPLTSTIRSRFLFVPTESNWVAVFDNWWQGTDAAAPICFLAAQLKCRGLRVVAVPHTMPAKINKDSQGRYGASILEVYNDTGNASRTIYAANDGGKWKFGQSGDPLGFEVLDAYSAPRVQDRFSHERLDSYLREMGLRAFDETFYLPGAILISKRDRNGASCTKSMPNEKIAELTEKKGARHQI